MNNLQNSLTLTNYKEPLIKINKKDGFGYYGAILVSLDRTKIQCHICGELFADSGCHARQKHKIDLRDYRERFQLAYTTSLISESERMRRKQLTLDWLSSLTQEQKDEYKSRALENSLKTRREMPSTLRLETRNKRGTCPNQILEKIKEVSRDLGYTPSLKEFVWATGGQRYKHLVYKVFGSWKNALKMAKVKPKDKTENGGRRHYENEELLEYIRIFFQENQKIPTSTDCNRGLLPSEMVFKNHFGGLPAAREMAGIEKL